MVRGQFSWEAIVLEHFQIQTSVFFLQALILKELLHTIKLSLVLRKLFFAIFMFLNFNSSFFQNIFHCNIPLGRGFPTIPYLLNSQNSYGSKNQCNQLKNRNLNRKLVKEIYDFHGSQPAIFLFKLLSNGNSRITCVSVQKYLKTPFPSALFIHNFDLIPVSFCCLQF